MQIGNKMRFELFRCEVGAMGASAVSLEWECVCLRLRSDMSE